MQDTASINRHLPIPIYFQLEKILRAKIEHGNLRPGDRLPTEQELQQQYRVSRATVRQALGNLVREGLIERKRSIGSVVAAPKVHEPFTSLNSYVLALINQGRDVRTEVLAFGHAQADYITRASLRLATHEQVLRIQRVTYVDRKPLNLATSCLRAAILPPVGREELMETGPCQSLYHVLKTKHKVSMDAADITVGPLALDASQARALGLRAGTPAIRRTRLVFDEQQRPIIFENAVFCHEFQIHTRRGEPAGGLE